MGFWCVVINDNMDYDNCSVTLFQNSEQAEKFLKKMWQNYMSEEINNGCYGNIDTSITYCDDAYGVIAWCDGCRCEFILQFAQFYTEI